MLVQEWWGLNDHIAASSIASPQQVRHHDPRPTLPTASVRHTEQQPGKTLMVALDGKRALSPTSPPRPGP
jgi:hypothetical protein